MRPTSSHQLFCGDDVLIHLRQEPGTAPRLLAAVMLTLAVWRHRYRSRRHLARLDHDDLRDIGMSRYEAVRESSKPFWRA